jgi:hypothetical protein
MTTNTRNAMEMWQMFLLQRNLHALWTGEAGCLPKMKILTQLSKGIYI